MYKSINMKNIQFTFYPFEDHNFGSWEGIYTYGNITIRGTEIFFKSPHIFSFQEGYEITQINSETREDIYYEGSHSLIAESLNSILEEMTTKKRYSEINKPQRIGNSNCFVNPLYDFSDCIPYDKSFESLGKESFMTENFYDLIKSCNPSKESLFLLSLQPTEKIWMFENKKILSEVIKELKNVIEVCNKNNVMWIKL